MEDNNRSFYAIIPANVRYDNSLNANAKLLYGEITALCNEKGYCWATNDYFSKLYNVSKTTISRWIKDLRDNGYVNVGLIYKQGTKEIDYRYIQICGEGINKNDNTPIVKNIKENNTLLNNTLNNTFNKNIKEIEKNIIKKRKENSDTLLLEFEEVWSFYPKKQGKKEALDFYIKARKEGIEKDTIINSIKKYVEYIKTTGWQQYRDGSRWFRNKGWEDDWSISNDSQFEEYEDTIKKIIDYMNDCANQGRNFKVKKFFDFYSTTISTKKVISDRLKEGYTKDDFADVIYNAYDKYVEHEFIAKDGRSSIQFYNPSFIFSSAEMEKNKNEYKNV